MCCLAVALAAGGLVARYALHDMVNFDTQLTQQLHTQIEHAIATNPDAKLVRGYLYSPEFRAGIMLTGFAMMSAVLLVLSTVGGAVGGLLGTRRKAAL